MKNKNKFEQCYDGYRIIVDGHTTFPEDICRMLDRLDFLEKERLKRSDNSDYASAVKDLNKWYSDHCAASEDNIVNEQLKSIIDRLNASHFK